MTDRSARYRVRGGQALRGTAFVQGSKNSALPMIAGALLAPRGQTVLRNVPLIEDIRRAVDLARAVGAHVELHESERTLVIDASDLTNPVLPAELTRRFRGSVLFIPTVLHRLGEVVYEGVGGCHLGTRALDFHYRGFARLGATVEGDADGGRMLLKADSLRGNHLYLDTPSWTGTENLVAAACLTPGVTVIDNAAREPEVLDHITFLTRMGARITGAGTGFLRVEGVDELAAVEYTVMPDRLDAGVLVMAIAMTQGEATLVGGGLENFGVARWKLEQMGVEFTPHGAALRVRSQWPLRPINLITHPYPGFATDLQSPLISLACLAEGASWVHETVHDARFALTAELNRMGANIQVTDNRAVIEGPRQLRGTEVVAHDLRTGIALVLAGLAAEGETTVTPATMIERGHAQLAERFSALGADITRES